MPVSLRPNADRDPVVSRRDGQIGVCIAPRPAGPSRPHADLSRLSLTPQTPTPSARRVARRSSTTSPPRRCVFHVDIGRTPPPATRRSGGPSPSPRVERSLGTAPKKRPSLTSRASPPRNPGCLRHHPHHPRSALDAEDDPGRLRRYVSSRARDRAAPEARSWALALQTERRGKVKPLICALPFLFFWTRTR